MLYDHVNYARWGVVYLLDMLQLENTAPEVQAEFIAENFVVKENRRWSSWNNTSSKCYESIKLI